MPSLLPPQTEAVPAGPKKRLALALAVGAPAALAVDLPLARWMLDDGLPKWLFKVCSLSEIFAHGWGVALIALAIFTLDPPARLQLPRLLTAAFGAGLCANLVKMLIARARPHHFDFVGGVFDTFGRLAPLGRGGSGMQGFPSSHAATVAGLAVVLSWLYPHGRRLFAILAALACLQRLAVGAHFLSDVLTGAALGIVFAQQCVVRGALARRFDRWEALRATDPEPATDTTDRQSSAAA